MGHIVSSLYNYFGYGIPGRTDDPDPVTTLTSRDRYLITNSWVAVRKNPTESGIALLNVFFKNHPEYVQLFPFRDTPVKELPNNKKYRAHGNAITYALSSVVDSLDDVDLLVSILVKIGESHAHRKVTEQGFVHLKEAVIELFSGFLNAEEMKAWGKALDVAFSVMITALNDLLLLENK